MEINGEEFKKYFKFMELRLNFKNIGLSNFSPHNHRRQK